MIDRVDVNMQAGGMLSYAIDTSARNITRESAGNHIPMRVNPEGTEAFVESAAVVTTAYGQTTGLIPSEIANDKKTLDRAWRYPSSGGDTTIEREMVNLISYQRGFEANVKATRTIEQNTGTILQLIA
jgi:hypothetical protein